MNSQTSRKLLIALFICGIAVESGRAQGERRSALPVRIIDGSTGKPISGARVFVDEARPPGGGGWGKGRNRLHIAVDGIWNYEPRRDEPTGTELVFRAEAEGYRPALGRTVVGEAPAGLTIRLEKAPRIEGRIVNADGTPAMVLGFVFLTTWLRGSVHSMNRSRKSISVSFWRLPTSGGGFPSRRRLRRMMTSSRRADRG